MSIGQEESTVIGFWLTPIDRCGVWTAHEVDVVADLLFGVAMGALGGFFGIGGGLVAIPLLGLIFGVEQALAQGTALVMMVPNIALGLWRYQQRCPLQWRQALPLAIGGLLTAGVGASLAVFLDPRVMRISFAVFLLALTGFNLMRAKSVVPSSRPRLDPRPSYLAVLGGACGVLGGFFSVGSSILAVPVLTSIFGISQLSAQGMALLLAFPSSAATLFTYAIHGHVNWLMGLALALGGLTSVSFGVQLAHRTPERILRSLFSGFLAICALLMLVTG